MDVEYREIPNEPGYRVGSDGSVWSLWRPKCKSKVWKRLRGRPNEKGHIAVWLKGHRLFYVHRLVLLVFVGPCPDGMECCHDPDPDPANNSIGNLRWDTPKANAADRIRHGRNACGEHCGMAKLTREIVLEIRASKESNRIIADRFGIDVSYARQIRKRITWKEV